MIVVYSATRNLYEYLTAAIGSLRDHNDARVIVLAEDDEIGIDDVEVINVSGQTYYPPNSANYNGLFTWMSMMRLCYVDLIPDADRVIQLDVDTIVCDNLAELWDMDLTGKWFAACHEYNGQYKPFGPKYYNVGVTVFNLKQMREDNAVPEMIDYLNNHKLWCTEQDVLNLFAGERGKAVEIPIRFNETKFTGFTENPAVVHYAGYKRWFDCSASMFRWEYLDDARRRHPEAPRCT